MELTSEEVEEKLKEIDEERRLADQKRFDADFIKWATRTKERYGQIGKTYAREFLRDNPNASSKDLKFAISNARQQLTELGL